MNPEPSERRTQALLVLLGAVLRFAGTCARARLVCPGSSATGDIHPKCVRRVRTLPRLNHLRMQAGDVVIIAALECRDGVVDVVQQPVIGRLRDEVSAGLVFCPIKRPRHAGRVFAGMGEHVFKGIQPPLEHTLNFVIPAKPAGRRAGTQMFRVCRLRFWVPDRFASGMTGKRVLFFFFTRFVTPSRKQGARSSEGTGGALPSFLRSRSFPGMIEISAAISRSISRASVSAPRR